jgi:hypothetical protein
MQIDTPSGGYQEGAPDGRKPSLKQRALHEGKRLFGIFIYLWALLALFALHETIVLAKHGIVYRPYGVALFNAWVLAKVMLVAEDLKLGSGWFKQRPPIYRILSKAVAFAAVFMAVHVVEHVLVGAWRGRTLAESFPQVGGGSFFGILSVAILISVALIPFFAVKEIDRALGPGMLRSLMLAHWTENGMAASKSAAGEKPGGSLPGSRYQSGGG